MQVANFPILIPSKAIDLYLGVEANGLTGCKLTDDEWLRLEAIETVLQVGYRSCFIYFSHSAFI